MLKLPNEPQNLSSADYKLGPPKRNLPAPENKLPVKETWVETSNPLVQKNLDTGKLRTKPQILPLKEEADKNSLHDFLEDSFVREELHINRIREESRRRRVEELRKSLYRDMEKSFLGFPVVLSNSPRVPGVKHKGQENPESWDDYFKGI